MSSKVTLTKRKNKKIRNDEVIEVPAENPEVPGNPANPENPNEQEMQPVNLGELGNYFDMARNNYFEAKIRFSERKTKN